MSDLRTILCVEDDLHIQKVAKLALEKIGGFDIVLCSSGEEALSAVADNPPDLILLDVMMPGMDGVATLAALREEPSSTGIPVAFMTAKVQPSEVERYRSLGAIGVISKPFDPMTLAAQVRDLWEGR